MGLIQDIASDDICTRCIKSNVWFCKLGYLHYCEEIKFCQNLWLKWHPNFFFHSAVIALSLIITIAIFGSLSHCNVYNLIWPPLSPGTTTKHSSNIPSYVNQNCFLLGLPAILKVGILRRLGCAGQGFMLRSAVSARLAYFEVWKKTLQGFLLLLRLILI